MTPSLLVSMVLLAQAQARPVIEADDSSTDVALGIVRSCGVTRRLTASPTVRPFVSLADLAPPPVREAWAVSIGLDLDAYHYVIDGLVEPEPPASWFDVYTPVLRPTGTPQAIRVYPSSWDAPQR